MNDDERRAEIDAIFIEAVELPDHQRAEFLTRRCDDLDPSIRSQIEKLLRADQDTANLPLPSDANPHLNVAKLMPSTYESTEIESVGSTIGNYHLLQKLGEGGMGAVYMADQKSPVKRRVALKVIKPGMDSKHVIARFEAERQALAMMDHPNIAKVLDAGTTESGRPFFVMELVKGIPITQYCDEKNLPIRTRLQLFESVCQAIQHAHQKSIIHRDLKPSNILVADYDDKPVPKVIDFGLAKALQQALTEKTLFTQFGQIVGTFEYMSPEQAKLNQLDIDTRTDIYSLGVLLYELMTGVTPLDSRELRSVAFDEMLRVIREDDPPRPSIRLTSSPESSAAAACRQTEPRKLQAQLSGDLDAIVMKSLDKDRTRRYESSGAFAADIRRLLDDQPVVARPPSSLYLAKKFINRHRAAMVTVSLVFCSLLVGLIGMTFLAQRNERLAAEKGQLAEERDQQRQQAEDALNLTSSMRLVSNTAYRSSMPISSLLVAIEATEKSPRQDGKLHPAIHEALINATMAVAGEPLHVHRGGHFDSVAMSPTGDSFATSSVDGTVRVWDLRDGHVGSLRFDLPGHTKPIKTIRYSPDGSLLATHSQDITARVWDLREPDPKALVLPAGNGLSLVFSKGGEFLVANDLAMPGSDVYPVRVWDLTAADPTTSSKVLRQHNDYVLSAALSVDNRWLYIGSRDRTVSVWDLSQDAPLSPVRIEELKGYVIDLEISSDGKQLHITSWGSSEAILYTLAEDGKFSSHRTTHGGGPTPEGAAFSPLNRWWAFIRGFVDEKRHELVIWDLATDDPESSERILRVPNAGFADSNIGGFSADDRWLLTYGNGAACKWDLHDDEPSPTVFKNGHDGDATWAISPNARWVVSASPTDGTARIWDTSRELPGESAFVLPGAASQYTRIAMSSGGRLLATSDGEAVRLWEMSEQGPVKVSGVVIRDDVEITTLAFSATNRQLFTGSLDGTIKMWDLQPHGDGQPLTLFGRKDRINALAVNPNGRWLAASAVDLEAAKEGRKDAGVVQVWELSETSPPTLKYALDVFAIRLAFSGNGRWLVTSKLYYSKVQSPAKLWDFHQADPTRSPVVLPGQVHDLPRSMHWSELSANGRWLITGSEDGSIRSYDLDADAPVATARVRDKYHRPIRAAAVCADGKMAWSVRFNPHVKATNQLWNLESATESDSVNALYPVENAGVGAFSPNGHWLAVGSDGGNIHLWDLTFESFPDIISSHMVLEGHGSQVRDVKFTPDNRWLVSSDLETTRVWPLELDTLLSISRRLAGRSLTEQERTLVYGESDSSTRQGTD